jgi:hypothetical protein
MHKYMLQETLRTYSHLATSQKYASGNLFETGSKRWRKMDGKLTLVSRLTTLAAEHVGPAPGTCSCTGRAWRSQPRSSMVHQAAAPAQLHLLLWFLRQLSCWQGERSRSVCRPGATPPPGKSWIEVKKTSRGVGCAQTLHSPLPHPATKSRRTNL